MKLLDYYRGQLLSMGFGFDNDMLVYAGDNQPAYFTYNKVKRRMALPTNAMIKKGMVDENDKECHAYHPLCESVLRGESGTIRFLKKVIKYSVWLNSMELITKILEVAADEKPVRQAAYKKFIAGICEGIKDPKFDNTLLASWKLVTDYVNENIEPKKRIHLFIASDYTIDGNKFVRASIYKTAFDEESEDDTAVYFGVKLRRKQDKIIIHRLLTEVFGWFPDECGSNDDRPYYGCLIRGWANYVLKYNQIVKGLRDHTALKPLEAEWIEDVDNMKVYENVIPTMPYNIGPLDDKAEKDTTAREFRLTPTQSNDRPVADRSSEREEVTTSGGKIDPSSIFRKVSGNRGGLLGMNRGPDLSRMTPAERLQYERTGKLSHNRSEIAASSLAEAAGGSVIRRNNNLLGGGSNNGLLGGGSRSLLGGNNRGSLLGGNSGGSLLGGNSGGGLLGGSTGTIFDHYK